MTLPLPACAGEPLFRLGTPELIRLMTGDEDRVPRGVIDECARRGDEMVRALQDAAGGERFWIGDAALGEWWLRLHAVMILGLIASERAGLLLVRFMRRMAEARDDDLQDWLAGRWPALFRNKPDAAIEAARELSADRSLDWYIRAQGGDVVVDAGLRAGGEALDRELDWLAGIARDEQENWDLRLCLGNTLLDFPRPRHRSLLEGLAARQTGWGVQFSAEDVREAYDGGADKPNWARFAGPWAFYSPEQIARRQERWAEEDASAASAHEEDEESFFEEAAEPYVRPVPRVGRNDPCPCGSGRKYKRCCLAALSAPVAVAGVAAAPAGRRLGGRKRRP